MLKIEIEIPRPWLTLFWIAGIAAVIAWTASGRPEDRRRAELFPQQSPHDGWAMPQGGRGGPAPADARAIEEEVRRLREERAVLERREGILRAQWNALAREERENPAATEAVRGARRSLVELYRDREGAERLLLQSLRELRDAQGRAAGLTQGRLGDGAVSLRWPVEPLYGLSAMFDDEGYEEQFGFPHRAVDIPVEQGSIVRAAADGVVADLRDNGLGFNSLLMEHRGGVATLYGHLTAFFVDEGGRVRAGDPIGRSGGRPGTPGAGLLSTGPHLHLEVIAGGERRDPLDFLPPHPHVGKR
jgi:murein DD-endopeptidase MepM/ murein hydrolase activator NlpD